MPNCLFCAEKTVGNSDQCDGCWEVYSRVRTMPTLVLQKILAAADTKIAGVSLDERDAIGEALDLAFSDQEHYLHYGNPEMDYGGEWEETAKSKAATFRLLGQVVEKLGFHGEAERWESLAKAVLGEESNDGN